VARRQKVDRGLEGRLDEFEKRMFILKIEYEKYFSGLEPIEPLKDRDSLRRLLREMTRETVTNTRQKHRLRSLRARWGSMEYYWQRNMYMIERGTHPKLKFRANMRDRNRREAALRAEERRAKARPSRSAADREEAAYQKVFDSYIEARGRCGQSTELQYESVRDVLKKQIRTIKSRYRCESVKFRVTIEDGKAKVKALPQR